MTESDKAATQNLTEADHAPGQTGGQVRRCDGRAIHIGRQPADSGWGRYEWHTSCPHTYHTLCRYNDRLDAVHRLEARLATLMDRDCPDVDDIDHTTERLCRAQVAFATTAAEHQALWDRAAALAAHATNTAKQHKGDWEFTLTYSPDTHGWMADEAEAHMRQAIERLTRYYAGELVEFHAVGERTQRGAPHVHGWYRLTTGGRITSKNFKRAYPIWNERRKLGRGHEGGHHAPIKRTSDFAGYIEKDLDTSWLVHNITNEPDEAEAHLQEAEDDHPSQDGPSDAPSPHAQPHDGQLRECS